MNRLLRWLLPVGLIVVFVMIMTSDWIMKRPLTGNDDVPRLIETLRGNILKEDWEQAAVDWEQLQAAWKTVAARVQFSAEREEMRGLTISLARLKGAIIAQDDDDALVELAEAEQRWRDLAR